MSSHGSEGAAGRPAIVEWLVRVNAQVSQWAAATTWWRLILLFIVILVAGSMISSQLRLSHDRIQVRVPGGREPVSVTIGGEEGIRIEQKDSKKTYRFPRSSAPAAGASGPLPLPPAAGASAGAPPLPMEELEVKVGSDNNRDDDDDDDRTTTRQVVTFRGILGDLGSTLLIILFAYLVAAKVVVRKVAESDAKMRTAVDAAEREAVERQLVQARLQVLQAQVEPHFLFNTLATVDYLIETDPPRASLMQKALITYLRGALPQMREGSSTLGREMSLIRSYLDLIKMRIEDRLEVEINVPRELDAAEFPPMMLQSIVENAIQHGIEPKPEGGKVAVTARVQGDQLWVEVDDTGIGFVDTDVLDAPTKGTGLGLNNIRERLSVLYGVRGRLQLRSDDVKGTRVRIGVPYRPAAATAPEADGSAGAGGNPAGNAA
jgi:signal transduction histidine kinase